MMSSFETPSLFSISSEAVISNNEELQSINLSSLAEIDVLEFRNNSVLGEIILPVFQQFFLVLK